MSLLNEIKTIKSSPKDLRKFGVTLGIAFGLLGLIFFLKQRPAYPYFLGLALFFFIFAFAAPGALKPIQKVWMTAALLMGWVMTRVILCVLFYLVITPIGFFLRISGKDLLARKFPEEISSYWTDHSQKDKATYENQY